MNINRMTTNRILDRIRLCVVELCKLESPLENDKIEVDEGFWRSSDARRQRARRKKQNTGFYDRNGNMTMDLDRKIVAIRYNSLNLPDTIQFMNGNQIINRYDATGRKLRTEYVTAPNNIVVPIGATIDAQGSVFTRNGTVYNNNIEYRFGNSGCPELARLHHPEGYLEYNTPDDGFEGDIQELNHYSYYRRDHLGNIREVWSAPYRIAKDYGPVQTFGAYTSQRTQYYPSGLPWKSDTGDSPTTQPYKYNGKELVETHGLNVYDSQARWYYPDMMRTTTMDPLAEKYYSVSPYAWCLNNPVKYMDLDGRKVYFAPGVSQEFKNQFATAVQYLNEKGAAGMLAKLHASDNIYYIARETGRSWFSWGKVNTINWDPDLGLLTNEDVVMSPTAILNHEIDHALQFDTNREKFMQDIIEDPKGGDYKIPEEKRVITGSEQTTAKKLGEIKKGEVTRKDHGGMLIKTKGVNSAEVKSEIIITQSINKQNEDIWNFDNWNNWDAWNSFMPW